MDMEVEIASRMFLEEIRRRGLDSGNREKGNESRFKIVFLYMECLPVCMSVHHMHAVPMEARRGHQIPWNWSYR